MKYRVLIADERKIVRCCLKLLLEDSGHYSVLGTADLSPDHVKRSRPDLILFGASDRRGGCLLESAAALKREHPECKLILVTDLPERLWLRRGKELGADGFVFLEDEPDVLSVADRVMSGEQVFPPREPSVAIGAASSRDFTDRELEVLHELLSGDGNIQIADRLGIRPDTVKFHLKSMLQKTGFHTRTELAVQARGLGITVR